MVLMIARQEAGLCEQSLTQGLPSEEAQVRVGKQLLAAKKSNKKVGKWQPKQEESTFSLVGFLWRGIGADESDDDEWNQSNWWLVHVTVILGTDKTRLRTQFK